MQWYERLDEKIRDYLPDMTVERDVPMSRHTSFRIGGPARRKASQPLEWPSAGSTFKRPEGYYAGTLIDQTGLKGLTVGGAQVSEKHAGFVINTGSATCADVRELIRRVQEAVYRAHGVRLEPEVRFVGE